LLARAKERKWMMESCVNGSERAKERQWKLQIFRIDKAKKREK